MGGDPWQRPGCRSPLQYASNSLSARPQPKHLLTPGGQRTWLAQGIENCENQRLDCAASLPCLTYQYFFLTTYFSPKADTLDHIPSSYKDTIQALKKGEHPLNTVRASDTHLQLLQHWAELVRAQQQTSSYWYLAEAPKHHKNRVKHREEKE